MEGEVRGHQGDPPSPCSPLLTLHPAATLMVTSFADQPAPPPFPQSFGTELFIYPFRLSFPLLLSMKAREK